MDPDNDAFFGKQPELRSAMVWMMFVEKNTAPWLLNDGTLMMRMLTLSSVISI
jgi:hypothetical protein